MIGALRKDAIVKALEDGNGVSVAELTHRLNASTATIRRDLDELAEAGLLIRVRGGAQRAEVDPDPLDVVAGRRAREKRSVGKAAARLVEDGSIILMDIGSTVAQMAEHLLKMNLTVVTTSLDLVRRLLPAENVEVVVAGGVLRRSYHSLVGALALETLSRVHADTCFLSASGVSAAGAVLDNTGTELPVKQAMIAAADRVVLLADGGKIPGQGLLTVCEPAQVDVLVTTPDARPDVLAVFRAAGAHVVLAGPN
ncbi:MAG: DeoR/GlpR family DNA-binding transcription regulator [Bifidobacteriaceae bacterium]|jgi:DeoR/GlpR family transcriptional regulator of sugar metabolism|nr:DeoR/GlpR family DNA-binding transcription regulator [Bifidobacteriaceae bacterium]